MYSALVVVYTAYCALQIVRFTLHYNGIPGVSQLVLQATFVTPSPISRYQSGDTLYPAVCARCGPQPGCAAHAVWYG